MKIDPHDLLALVKTCIGLNKSSEVLDASEAALKPTEEKPLEQKSDEDAKVTTTGTPENGKPEAFDRHVGKDDKLDGIDADKAVEEMASAIGEETDQFAGDKGGGEPADGNRVVEGARDSNDAAELPKVASDTKRELFITGSIKIARAMISLQKKVTTKSAQLTGEDRVKMIKLALVMARASAPKRKV